MRSRKTWLIFVFSHTHLSILSLSLSAIFTSLTELPPACSSMAEIAVPHFFICPISLQMITDPVTVVTGITYDRKSIEEWLLTSKNYVCPVTKQPLPRNSDLMPNHTLQRLIKAWCDSNARELLGEIPTPKLPICKPEIVRLVRSVAVSDACLSSLKKLESLAMEDVRNGKYMEESGVIKAMVLFITRCFKEDTIVGLEESLKILSLFPNPSAETKLVLHENYEFIDSLTWVLEKEFDKTQAIQVLRLAIEMASKSLLERLKPRFFKNVVNLLREKSISESSVKSTLLILVESGRWGRNRIKMADAGAVHELIELELKNPAKNITELVFNLLAHLCTSAEGRAELLGHAGGIAMVSKRILRVSISTDDKAVQILSLIAQRSATKEVLMEMLRIGGVCKLCMVMQANCSSCLKQKAREILRLHSSVWSNSPCISIYLLTRDPR